MHGDLDFAFMLVDSEDAAALWPHVLAGRVPTFNALTVTDDRPEGEFIDPAMRP